MGNNNHSESMSDAPTPTKSDGTIPAASSKKPSKGKTTSASLKDIIDAAEQQQQQEEQDTSSSEMLPPPSKKSKTTNATNATITTNNPATTATIATTTPEGVGTYQVVDLDTVTYADFDEGDNGTPTGLFGLPFREFSSKQLRTICSRLNLKGVKNFKKHEMQERLIVAYKVFTKQIDGFDVETTTTPTEFHEKRLVIELKHHESLLIELNQKLLDAIVAVDYDTYDELCADDMSCLEPESNQNVVVGKDFHKYYFDVFGGAAGDRKRDQDGTHTSTTTKVTMVRPHVQWIGGTDDKLPSGAVLSYVKLTQTLLSPSSNTSINPVTRQQSETRVWERRDNGRKWVNIHFHKSPEQKFAA